MTGWTIFILLSGLSPIIVYRRIRRGRLDHNNITCTSYCLNFTSPSLSPPHNPPLGPKRKIISCRRTVSGQKSNVVPNTAFLHICPRSRATRPQNKSPGRPHIIRQEPYTSMQKRNNIFISLNMPIELAPHQCFRFLITEWPSLSLQILLSLVF